jgi:uncharacterized membrane protein YkoI
MKTLYLSLALTAFAATSAAAQSAQSTTAVKIENHVNPTLAGSVKVSADSAMVLARSHADWGEVSSGELTMKDKRLVYELRLLNKSKRATEVTVDAMSGDVVENKQFGGLKSTVIHHKENNKLKEAKRDSAARNP